MSLKEERSSWSVSFENIITAWPQCAGLPGWLFLWRARQEDRKFNVSISWSSKAAWETDWDLFSKLKVRRDLGMQWSPVAELSMNKAAHSPAPQDEKKNVLTRITIRTTEADTRLLQSWGSAGDRTQGLVHAGPRVHPELCNQKSYGTSPLHIFLLGEESYKLAQTGLQLMLFPPP